MASRVLNSLLEGKRGLSRNALLNTAGQGVQATAWIVAFPFAVRVLGIERVGLLGLVWAILTYATVFDWGLSRASTRALAQIPAEDRRTERNRWAWTAIYSQMAFGLVGTMILLVAAALFPSTWVGGPENLAEEARVALRIVAFAIPLVLVSNGFQSVLEADLRFAYVNIAKSLAGVLSAAALLLGATCRLDLPGFTALLAAARVAATLLMAAVTMCVFPAMRRAPVPEWSIARRLLGFGGWIMISNWVGPVLLMGDRLIVAGLLSVQDLGFYTVPQEVVIRLLILHATVATAAYPAFSGMFSQVDAKGLRNAWREGLLLMGLIAVGVVAIGWVGPTVLRIWLGREVSEGSGALLRVLSIGGALQGLAQLPAVLVQSAGHPDRIVKTQVVVLGPYLVAAVLLVRSYGTMGAAWAWVGRSVCQMVAYFLLATGILRTRAVGGLTTSHVRGRATPEESGGES